MEATIREELHEEDGNKLPSAQPVSDRDDQRARLDGSNEHFCTAPSRGIRDFLELIESNADFHTAPSRSIRDSLELMESDTEEIVQSVEPSYPLLRKSKRRASQLDDDEGSNKQVMKPDTDLQVVGFPKARKGPQGERREAAPQDSAPLDMSLVMLPLSEQQASAAAAVTYGEYKGILSRMTRSLTSWYPRNSRTPKHTIVFAKDGDIKIHLVVPVEPTVKTEQDVAQNTGTTEIIELICSSDAIRMVAQGWRWQEIFHPNKVRQYGLVVLAGVDVDSFMFVMNVAHLQFDKLPQQMTFQEMVNLARFCYEYNAVHAIKGFACTREVLPAWSVPSHKPYCLSGKEEWIFVAWTFHLEDEFRPLLLRLVKESSLNMAAGDLCDDIGDLLTGTYPKAVIGFILEVRKRYIEEYLDLAYDWFNKLLRAKCEDPHHDSLSCSGNRAGAFMVRMTDNGLPTAKPDVKELHLSVNGLRKILMTLMGNIPPPGSYSDDRGDYTKIDLVNLAPDCRDDSIWELLVAGVMDKLEEEVDKAFRGYMGS